MIELLWTLAGFGILVSMFAGLWKSFEKAGIAGWKTLVPLYNIYLLVKIAGSSGWLILGFFIPIINIFVPVYIYYRFARNFGKGKLFSVFTGLLPYFAVPVIGFDSSNYTGSYRIENDQLA